MAVSSGADDFLHGGNAVFIAELYEQYLRDPGSVDESWKGFFAGLKSNGHADEAPGAAAWGRMRPRVISNGHDAAPGPNGAAHAAPAEGGRQATLDSIRALMLIRAYRVRGHLYARLDPLGLHEPEHHPELDPATYGFGEDDWDRPIFIDGVLARERASMREIMAAVHDIYCSSIGVEFMHIQDPDQKAWIQKRIERPLNRTEFTERGRRAILERLTEAEVFEHFLDRKYIGTKRFGLEGGEALIPALEQIIKRGGEIGLEEAVVGMAHRGRLNVLANFMGKPFQAILSEFQGQPANPEDVQGSGDVKYHLGTSSDREFDGNVIHLSLCPNPSHLEIVNPVVIGRARAKQEQRGDHKRDKVMPILLHGDAAFIGQGLVAETFELSELRGYRVGGTIHIVINNQIGFTTSPTDSRSSPYCSGMAQIVQAPVFHVNGDDPEAVVHVARIATEFRFRFKCDVVIDMYCYRRQGHNEADEPAFTQPLMYDAIDKHATTRAVYADRLVAEGLISREEADGIVESFRAQLENDFEAAKSYKPNKADWLEGAWSGIEVAAEGDRRGTTAVPLEQLKAVGSRLATVPDGFNLNPKIARQFRQRARVFETGEGLDWANAEALALGTLAVEGVAVRLSGQDCGRGTFSQRHAMLRDQTDERQIHPAPACRPGAGPGRDHRQPARRSVRARLRIRLFAERAACAGDVGGAVRRLCQWRAGGDGPVHLLRRVEMAAHVGPRDAVAARLRGPGAGALLRPAGALPPALRGRQHAGHLPDHAGQLFPRPAPPGEAGYPQAADRNDAEIAVAAQALRFRPRRACGGQLLPPGHAGNRRGRRERVGPPGGALHGQGLLRPAPAAPRGKHFGCRAVACRTTLSLPGADACRRACPLSECRDRLVPGRAGEHGRMDLRGPADRRGASSKSAPKRSSGPAMSAGLRRRLRRRAS